MDCLSSLSGVSVYFNRKSILSPCPQSSSPLPPYTTPYFGEWLSQFSSVVDHWGSSGDLDEEFLVS